MQHAGDVAIVGCGPAGIAAAVRAVDAGARVLVLDEAAHAGGQVWRHRSGTSAISDAARQWLDRFAAARAAGRIALLERTAVVDVEPGPQHTLVAQRGGRAAVVRARALVVATGARERFVPFPGWTVPGVIGAGAAQALLKSGLDVRGRRAVVAGTGPLLLPVAAALAAAGARVVEVAEQAPQKAVTRFAAGLWRTPGRVMRAAAYRLAFRDARYTAGTWVLGAQGGARVTGVVLTDGARSRSIACDLLCVGYGLVPATELAVLAGCGVGDDGAVTVDDWQRTSVDGILAAGETTGIGGEEAAVAEGTVAGVVAAGGQPDAAALRARDAQRTFARRLAAAFVLRPELRDGVEPGTIVCRCEDVPHARLRTCNGEREARLLMRAGMGPCQARVCGPAMQYLYGWRLPGVRPPAVPATIDTLIDAFTSTARSE